MTWTGVDDFCWSCFSGCYAALRPQSQQQHQQVVEQNRFVNETLREAVKVSAFIETAEDQLVGVIVSVQLAVNMDARRWKKQRHFYQVKQQEFDRYIERESPTISFSELIVSTLRFV